MIEHDAGYFLAARRCPNGRPAASFDGRSLDVAIEPDPVTGSAQWFHFRAFAREAVPIRIVNAAASSYPRGWSESIVWARHGSRRWTPVTASYADGMLSFSHVVVPKPVPTFGRHALATDRLCFDWKRAFR